MIGLAGAGNLHKIVVLNPKGGCGKTTLATNLASCFAARGEPPLLVDFDPQGFCIRWLEKRAADRPEIFGMQVDGEFVGAPERATVEPPPDAKIVIVDLPAAIPHARLHAYTYMADSVLLPIVPSEIDIHSATRFIAELLLDVQLDRREQKLAIVANRVRSRTKSYEMLVRFLTSLEIPMIATLRDSQNFVHASALGIGVCELPPYRAREDTAQLETIVRWLDKRRAVTRDRQALIARAAHRRVQETDFAGSDTSANLPAMRREIDDTVGH